MSDAALNTPPAAARFEILKLEPEGCLIFGYANISISKSTSVAAGGEQFFDLQEDSMPPDVLEKGVYEYVLEAREADEMHKGGVKGMLVESMMFTPDKLERFATDPTTGVVSQTDLMVLKRLFPPRWWVGFKVDPDAFAKVRKGEYRMFSIAGEADRVEVK